MKRLLIVSPVNKRPSLDQYSSRSALVDILSQGGTFVNPFFSFPEVLIKDWDEEWPLALKVTSSTDAL
ncbi:hypothetical protein [Moorella sp. E308F]|jgi:hypothetical protein|uniref:hypothetical protein n=1 Tax=Moorella sp. E308F TaxID=2572682 RepID=UPI001C0EBF43|nr:hypothetical protein [Moorella sp. E308F]